MGHPVYNYVKSYNQDVSERKIYEIIIDSYYYCLTEMQTANPFNVTHVIKFI